MLVDHHLLAELGVTMEGGVTDVAKAMRGQPAMRSVMMSAGIWRHMVAA